ncbi:MAG TPA: FecR family protein [Devosia sp.]|nr:FecR family protein [Devosia sp.]
MRKLISIFAVAALLAAAPATAWAAAAGSAKGVKQDAAAALEGQTRTLVVGSDIFIGDEINTDAKGQVQVLFADNTKLVVGPNSSLKIDDYLLRNNGDPGKFVVDMLSGSFRFATGNGPKSSYQINTPTGTIGVRGTHFEVWVFPDTGFARILRDDGTVLYKALGEKEWNVLDDTCEVGEIGDGQSQLLGDARDSTGQERADYKHEFRYADNQSPLLRAFWFIESFECLHKAPNVPSFPTNPNFQSKAPPPEQPTIYTKWVIRAFGPKP